MKSENSAQSPRTALEAIRYFADADRCHEFLTRKRWPDSVLCAHCGSEKIGKLVKSGTRRLWNCKSCKKQFTVKVGTVFEDSPLGLDKWLPALWLVVNAKNGISSWELARSLGVTQKTAWFIGHRIRKIVEQGSFMASGDVEADETFVGGKMRFKHKDKRIKGTGPIAMKPVMGILQRTTDEGPSRAITRVLETTKKKELQGYVQEFVAKGANLYTDALPSYTGLTADYKHEVINHAKCYAIGKIHTNGLENFWSLVKRTIRGTYICPSPIHLFRYMDEQTFRFNERTDNDGGRFQKASSQCAGKRLTYKKLIAKPPKKKV